MRTSSCCPRLALAIACSLWCSPLLGQWVVGAEVGADRFWGGSEEKTGAGVSFLPYRPTTFGVGLKRQTGKLALGLQLRYGSAGLALEGAEGVVAAPGVFTMYSLIPELVYQIATVGPANRLLLRGGPLIEVWSVADEESQTRVGVQSAVSFMVPLGGRLAGTVSAGAALIPSPFGEDQLDSDFERRPLWRRRFAGGLEFRL
ncbi:MAG: hypothetical protein H0T58_00585 [Gemmatimonadales bacterium]|nr:hypothetical protein [Gemmatimonadales bacterium]